MKTGTTLHELLTEVRRQSAAKRDLLANTREQLRMVEMSEFPDHVALVALQPDRSELERFRVSTTAHTQIAAGLNIPWKYYNRLLADHRDLVIQQVNALFEREPGTRMVRTLDGAVRAFLSDRYRRIDNDTILAETLPALFDAGGALPANRIVGSHLAPDHMRIRVVWTAPELEQTIGTTRDGKPDVVKPGFEIGNSETGCGTFKLRGFFYRGYCDNGCIWEFGNEMDLSYSRTHLGGRLAAGLGAMELFSDETKQKDDAALVAQVTDIMRAIGTAEFSQKMGDTLRALKGGAQIEEPAKAIEVLSKAYGLRERETDRVLENLIRDADYSRWGALNAVTAVSNREDVTEERALELQDLGAQLISMQMNQWSSIARAGVLVERAA